MMRKSLFTITTTLITNIIFACSCEYGGNFLYAAKFSKTIVKAKIIEHIYHTENGKQFTDFEAYVAETINNEFDPYYGTGRSMKIEILELIRGTETRKIIEIFNTDGADCRASIEGFEKGKIYVMSIYQPKRTKPKLPNETDSDYAINGCSENWVEFFPETNEIFGIIKGKSYRRKTRTYSFDRLIKKITNHS